MRVWLDAPYGLSRAMTRVSRALAAHMPPGVTAASCRRDADLVLLHVVGFPDAVAAAQELLGRGQRYAVAQYCLRTTQQPGTAAWQPMWAQADAVWSYYDLAAACRADGVVPDPRVNFHMSPLGIDGAFLADPGSEERHIGVVTSGYVSTGQEAIWEFALAAERTGRTVKHIGPHTIGGMPRRPRGWSAALGISDESLAAYYRSARWVSGLRYAEGFEMPVIEGLSCGARPVVFDRADMRRWYEGHAVFVPELPSEELTEALTALLRSDPEPVTAAELEAVRRRFDWAAVAGGFWRAVTQKKEKVA